ncbi:hypothetical protein K6V78_03670 [Streptococcus gallolyticus]|uniref:TcpD family membrane protein n=1 Tax=Streptococcus hepaticus TaxID=3349163 RepID=UPI001C94F9A1|nr:hypothetical protein [Streptococcus gallolyticus]MBY5040682.1 hypothetical protein [Streptococcus gallolyticus]
MQNIWNWFVSDIGVWCIVGFASWKAIESVREQKIGKAIGAIAIGAFAYYFVKNPETVLNWGSSIIGKFFGK